MAEETGKAEASAGAASCGGGGSEAVKKRAEQSVAFHELFSFAAPLDWLLMAAGSAGAVVHGAAMPVFFLLFGELVNGFGKNQHHLRRMTDEVSKARISGKSLIPSGVAISMLALVTDAQSDCLTLRAAVLALFRLPRPRRLRLLVPG